MNMMIMRYVGAMCIVCLCAGEAFSENLVEFRPVLSADELDGKKVDILKSGAGDIFVWRRYYLSERDLEKVEVFRSAAGTQTLLAGFFFNEDGRKRLYRFNKKFAKRRVAILVRGKLVTAPVVWVPEFTGGRVVVRWPGTEKELMVFAGTVNKGDPGIVALYIEESGRYNDVAADAWARVWGRLNGYFEEKRKQYIRNPNFDEVNVTLGD